MSDHFFMLSTWIIVLVTQTFSDAYKMVIIYGEPQTFTTFSTQTLSFEACVDYCFKLDSCMAIYSESATSTDCQVYEVGQLSTVKESFGSGGGKVAMKMNSSDSVQCPLTAEENSMTTGTSFNQYNITSSNGIWKFTSFICPTNFTMFNRPLGQWCIGVISSTTLITQEQSVSKCSSIYSGILSGLQSMDEYNYIIESARLLLSQVTETWKLYRVLGFWVNGNRKTDCMDTQKSDKCNGTNEFTFNDPLLSAYEGYVWGDGQPSGTGNSIDNCIQYAFNSKTYESLGVDDYHCDATNATYSAFIGYVCGVRPTTR